MGMKMTDKLENQVNDPWLPEGAPQPKERMRFRSAGMTPRKSPADPWRPEAPKAGEAA